MNNKVSFYRPKEVNISEFEAIVNNMRVDLERLCKGDFDSKEINDYVAGLVKEATPLKHRSDMLFWKLDEPENMPADARVDFVFTPTYIASAFIMKAALLTPELMNDDKIKSTLAAALLGSTARGFAGHGYENNIGRVRAIKIFASAGARQFIEEYPNLCPDFTRLYKKTVNDIKSWVKNNEAVDPWGYDFSNEAEEVLKIEAVSK